MNCVVMQTDFGCMPSPMAGVCKIVDKNLEVYPVTYNVENFDIEKAGKNLVEVMPYWKEGTVFVSVVDPGVGTSRRAVVAKTEKGHYIVTPDNGILGVIDKYEKITECRIIDQDINRYHGNEWSEKSDIFHGRDVFAYCGAKLASSKISYEEVGQSYPTEEIVQL
ncbi:MAG: SAM-dependent chlorinase/fluorinase [Erysipelotrichaceae bacterium]|nr:SAM-dependent chlorinase/fluorinase [Erysipelotrichaceae bacterium]